MIVRLAARNMKHCIVHDVIYFVTLMTGIALVYAFYAVEDQFIMNELMEDDKIVFNMQYVMPGIGVILVVVLAFLLVYANHFLLNQRKKEFGVYMLLGMEKTGGSAFGRDGIGRCALHDCRYPAGDHHVPGVKRIHCRFV